MRPEASSAVPRPSGSGNSVGLHLEPLGAHAFRLEPDRDPRSFVGELPPALLLPRHRDEPTRADLGPEPHVRGAGLSYPEEAQVGPERGGGRYPLALAWRDLRDPEAAPWSWTIDGRTSQASAREALAVAAGALVKEVWEGHVPPPTALVIPNDLDESHQQALCDALYDRGLSDVKLVWRPVAAALEWLEGESPRLLKDLPDRPDRQRSLGTILVVSFGGDGAEASCLELIARPHAGTWEILPARRRPLPGTCEPFAGRAMLERLVDQLMGAAHALGPWTVHWAHTLLPEALTALRDPTSRAYQRFQAPWLASHATNQDPNLFPWLTRRAGGEQNFSALIDRAIPEDTELLSVLVVGSLGGTVLGGKCLVEHVLDKLHEGHAPRWIEGRDTPMGALARGAARFRALADTGRTAYLDTLPSLELAVVRRGVPQWEPLLESNRGFVDGGKPWKREEELRGLNFSAGSRMLELVIQHEDFATVRRLSTTLPEPLSRLTPVQLAVSIEPAMGNARLEVKPEQEGALGPDRVFVRWNSMTDTGHQPQGYLEAHFPQIAPPPRPRHSSEYGWETAEPVLRTFLQQWGPAQSLTWRRADRLRKALNKNRPGEEATSVSSDGHAPHPLGTEVLKDAVDVLLQRLASPGLAEEERKRVEGVLAYTSSPDPRLQKHLATRLTQSKKSTPPETVRCCGFCLRHPLAIAAFAKLLRARLQTRGAKNQVWLKAFAQMLRYRPDATAKITNDLATDLLRLILGVLASERARGEAKFIFRSACMSAVYLLRRRVYDDTFLDPDSDLARDLKAEFNAARRQAKSSDLELIGGRFNLDEELKRLIDYVDRKGTGLPGMQD